MLNLLSNKSKYKNLTAISTSIKILTIHFKQFRYNHYKIWLVLLYIKIISKQILIFIDIFLFTDSLNTFLLNVTLTSAIFTENPQ